MIADAENALRAIDVGDSERNAEIGLLPLLMRPEMRKISNISIRRKNVWNARVDRKSGSEQKKNLSTNQKTSRNPKT